MRQLLVCSVLALVFFCGCGKKSDLDFGTVSGIVTMDGAPLPGVIVLFQPSTGRPSQGATDADGSYQLGYSIQKKGALVGLHVVSISTPFDDDNWVGKAPPDPIPARYNMKSELNAEVQGGHNEFDFELNSK